MFKLKTKSTEKHRKLKCYLDKHARINTEGSTPIGTIM